MHIKYQERWDLFVNQTKYATKLLKKADIDTCKPAPTPTKPHSHLLIVEGTPPPDATLYRSLVGALQYLTFIRPDIAHVVGVMCQYMSQPTDAQFFLVKMILRYIKGTLHCGLTYKSGLQTPIGLLISTHGDPLLVMWCSLVIIQFHDNPKSNL